MKPTLSFPRYLPGMTVWWINGEAVIGSTVQYVSLSESGPLYILNGWMGAQDEADLYTSAGEAIQAYMAEGAT